MSGSRSNAQAPVAGLGSSIAQARRRAGLSQTALAAALGIQPSAVSQWESGRTIPSLLAFREMVAVPGTWPLLAALLPPTQPHTAAGAGADQQPPQADAQELARLVDQANGQHRGAGATGDGQWWQADRAASTQRGGAAALAPRPSRKKLARLVNKGLSDAAIGQRYGRAATTVATWRQAEGLERSRGPRPSRRELTRLLGQGLSDRTIGQRYAVKAATVRMWRYDYELRRSDPPARPSRETLAALISQGLTDTAIGQRYGRAALTVAGWRSAHGLLRERPAPGVDRARVLELRRRGLPAPDIAAELGCTPGQVYRLSRKPRAARQRATQPPATTSPSEHASLRPGPQGARRPQPQAPAPAGEEQTSRPSSEPLTPISKE